jgi:nicotinamide mononucleotide transporter
LITLTILQALSEYFETASTYELIGTVTGIAGVWLAARENMWTWPVGLISVTMQVIVFLQARLYADMGLNLFYAVTSIYGWYYWLHGGDQRVELPVSRVGWKELSLLCLAGAVFTFGLGYLLENFTDADLSYIDSATTGVSLVGYWLLARKYIENWVVWIVVDSAYVGVYYYKGLYLFSGMFFLFLILAAYGYLAWKKSLRQQIAPS